MQIIRTVSWALITAILVAFIAMNWNGAAVNFWPIEGENKYLHFEWPVGVIALIFFLLGFLPLWLVKRAQVWRLNRRIASLESSLRSAAAPAMESETTPVPETASSPNETAADQAPPVTSESRRGDVS